MEGLSERQYAARVGLSRGAIQKAKATGRLVLHSDGSIDAEASDALRAQPPPGVVPGPALLHARQRRVLAPLAGGLVRLGVRADHVTIASFAVGVLAVPALQTLALFRGRAYVSSEDLEYLLPLLLWHRIEFIPGTADEREVILSAAQKPLEQLSRSTLKRSA